MYDPVTLDVPESTYHSSTKKLIKGTGGLLVHPSLKPEGSKWYKNMTAPKAYLKRYDEDQISNMTLCDNEHVADLACAEVMTNTSETIFGDNDSARINEESACTCEAPQSAPV